MAAFRSGLPYTIFAPLVSPPLNQAVLVGARTDVKDLAALKSSFPVTAGKALVNVADRYAQPPAGEIGTLGRNALGGPGFWNVDLSLTRSFGFAPLGESGRIRVRSRSIQCVQPFEPGVSGHLHGRGVVSAQPEPDAVSGGAASVPHPAPHSVAVETDVPDNRLNVACGRFVSCRSRQPPTGAPAGTRRAPARLDLVGGNGRRVSHEAPSRPRCNSPTRHTTEAAMASSNFALAT